MRMFITSKNKYLSNNMKIFGTIVTHHTTIELHHDVTEDHPMMS